MTRSQAALAAVRAEFAKREARLDADDDVVRVTISIKFIRASPFVRGLVYEEERLVKERDPLQTRL